MTAPLDSESPQAPGASDIQIQGAESTLGISLPPDYVAFLRWSNGWEGQHGRAYLQLVATHELAAANDDVFREGFPGFVAVGGDGGLETYALVYSGEAAPSALVAVDRIGGADGIWRIASTFAAAIARLAIQPSGPWEQTEERD